MFDKAWIGKLLLLAGSSAGALGVAEVALRLAPALMPEDAQLRVFWREGRVDASTYSIPDPYIGFLYKPNDRRTIDRSDVHFTYTTDEFGFRNRTPWPSGADLVLIGDSWTFGYGVEDHDTWVRLTADSLPHLRVVNLGLIGSAPHQALRIYERFGAPMHPKLLVYGLFPGNDIDDDRLFQAWLAAGGEGNYDVWRFYRGQPPSRTGSLFASSRVLLTLKEVRRLWGSTFSGRTIDFPDSTRLRLAPGTLMRSLEHARADDPDFERVLRAIEAMRTMAAAQGTQFLVVLFPSKEEVYLPVVGAPVPNVLGAFPPELRRRGITYLDLTPAFQAHARAGERLYFEIDGHANRHGNRLMAATVLEYLREHLPALDR